MFLPLQYVPSVLQSLTVSSLTQFQLVQCLSWFSVSAVSVSQLFQLLQCLSRFCVSAVSVFQLFLCFSCFGVSAVSVSQLNQHTCVVFCFKSIMAMVLY